MDRVNYFIAAFLGILGLTAITTFIMETDRADKLDDLLLITIGFVGVYIYVRRFHLTYRYLLPLTLIFALVIKIGAVFVEHADASAVGDDFGIAETLVLASIFVGWQTLRRRLK